MLKKSSLLLGILILFGIGSVIAQPALTVPENDFDFGYVPQHAKVSHVYWLHSTGTETLEIKNVKPGCGCTKAPLEKNSLVVGDSTRLEVIYSTKTYRGRQTKRPSILTNTGPSPTQVSFSAQVMPDPTKTYPITISPYKFDISQFGEAERKKLTFEITNISESDIELKLVDLPVGMFKVTLPKKIKSGDMGEGEIEISDEYVDENFEKSMTIELNDNAKSRFTIPIRRQIRSLSSRDGK